MEISMSNCGSARFYMLLAALVVLGSIGGCAKPAAERVNGDAWRYGFSYPGPNYPDTGH
jgi:hypothetical protein